MSGYCQVKDVEYMLKVHDVKTPSTTTIRLIVSQNADGDTEFSEDHSTPINEVVSSVPQLLTGYTDTETNGPLGEWIRLVLRIAGGAGEWAVVEVFEVKKIW